ncbi:hypothetical protein [Anaeromyxobacter oryzae]|uniref:Lipoprotein n=1 Tax=Anaeromyxobacter oryzae TaxID=2918170 RepID=A0ABN6MY85_9BACT|nr:hypothetical protein [Anaeromyxobacter oryzae]BDG05922.1 hypothetical protein AMOR_49180 [Anaeromyxobacter oryzae]
MRPVHVLLLVGLAAGCARAQRPEAQTCDESWEHVDGTLRAGLERYLADLDRYLTSAIPGARTEAAQERARAAASAWAEAHRDPYVASCRVATDKERRCVLAAATPVDLASCGLASLVRSFTDDVLPAYASRPLEGVGSGAAPDEDEGVDAL